MWQKVPVILHKEFGLYFLFQILWTSKKITPPP